MILLLGSFVLWGGYVLTSFGWAQVKGCQAGLADFALPGRDPSLKCGAGWEAAALASKAAYDAQYKQNTSVGTLPSTYPDVPAKGGLHPSPYGQGPGVNAI